MANNDISVTDTHSTKYMTFLTSRSTFAPFSRIEFLVDSSSTSSTHLLPHHSKSLQVGNVSESTSRNHRQIRKTNWECYHLLPFLSASLRIHRRAGKGVFLVKMKNAFVPIERVYSMNTYSRISTVPRGRERSE